MTGTAGLRTRIYSDPVSRLAEDLRVLNRARHSFQIDMSAMPETSQSQSTGLAVTLVNLAIAITVIFLAVALIQGYDVDTPLIISMALLALVATRYSAFRSTSELKVDQK